MIHNKLCSLLSILLYCKLSEGPFLEKGCYNIILSFIAEACDIIIRYKNNGFNMLKAIESLVIGDMIKEVEEWSNIIFLENLNMDLVEKTGFCYFGSKREEILAMSSIQLKSELSCMAKIVGYPYVDMDKGTRELQHHQTTEVVELNYKSIYISSLYVKKSFIQTYIQKHGNWPLVSVINPPLPSAMGYAMMNNKDPDSNIVKAKHGLVSIYDYSKIELLPCMEFTKIESIIPYLKDKTTAVCRTETLYKVLGVPADDITNHCDHDIDMTKPKYNRENISESIKDLKIKIPNI